MSDEIYEKYIIQKYSIAVAIAVIKNKPHGMTITEYINELRNNIGSQVYLFQDISISECDFDNSDDEQIKDLDKGFENGTNQSKDPEIVFTINNSNKVTNNLFDIVKRKIDQNNYDEQNNRLDHKQIENTDFEVDNIICNDAVNDRATILKGISIDKNASQEPARNNSIKEILDIFKDIDSRNEVFISTSTPKNYTQSTFCETSQINITNNLKVNNEVTFCSVSNDKKDNDKNYIHTTNPFNAHDSQETELYTLHGYTDNFTHISQSQDNIIVPKNLLHNCNNRSNILSHNNKGSKTSNELEKVVVNKETDESNKYKKKNTKSEHNVVTEKQLNNKISNDNIDIEKCNFIEAKNSSTISNDRVPVRKRRITNSITSSSDEYSFLFKDITNNVHNNKPNFKEQHNIDDFDKIFSGSYDIEDACSSISFLKHTEVDGNSFLGSNLFDKDLQNNQLSNIYGAEYEINSVTEAHNSNLSENQFICLKSIECPTADNTKINDVNKNDVANELNYERDGQVDTDKFSCKCGQFSSGYETQCTSKNDRIQDTPKETEDKSDGTETLEEIVTFKILEELNRVKNYISKQDRRLSDSGRSNSQGSQLSGVKINESGYCLLNYITQYQLFQRTTEISEEVSRVFGKFVDKLHEDENYPQFLEKTLEKVQELVTDIYEGARNQDLLKKDDQTDRLLLLNRSTNIIKYTIEKILPILEDVCVKLQNKDFLEITCLVTSENLCYILHVLEILLKRYNSAMASSQTSTQLSQDDERSLKRSTITEIWRKKWNLSKSDVSEGSFKKKCVLREISEVLNKIIVQGMDGYSLISFAALQCFNLLQSK